MPRHRGYVMLWALVIMLTMVALVSLGVDVARVQMAKTQLQAAVDSAARYAARGAFDSTAITRAITAAAQNNVDGSPLVLQNSDVELGRWNFLTQTFTAATSSGGTWVMPDNTQIDAVRITGRRATSRSTGVSTPFASVLGRRAVDIQASVIATGSAAAIPPLALHRFNESSGSTCRDDASNPLVQHAYIANTSKISWTGNAITFKSATKAATSGAATNVVDNIKTTNQFTVFGRFSPDSYTQTNATIVSVAGNSSNANFSVRQQGNRLEFRLRTSGSGAGESTGTAAITSSPVFANGHTDYDFCATYDGTTLKLYTRPNQSNTVAGTRTTVSTTRTGNLSNWNNTYRLVYGNEDSNDCPYLGDILHIGIYDTAMNDNQVNELFGDPEGHVFYPTASSVAGAGGRIITVR